MNIEQADKFYSKKTTKELREIAASNTKRVCCFRDADKWTCWTDIMVTKFGKKNVQAYLEATNQI